MKRYFTPEKRKFEWGEMLVVVLGERGRGRQEAYIPFHAPIDCNLVELGTTRSGSIKIVPSQSSDGWLAVVSGSGTYTRGTYGTVYVPPQMTDKIKVIASGYGAYGGCWTYWYVV